MSDYLWDKTGAADPEVERLEDLLGAFAHRPRPLELPAAEARPRRAPWLRYAAAAAVLLAVGAGALVTLRLARTDAPGPVAGATPTPTSEPQQAATPGVTPQQQMVGVTPDAPAPRRGRGGDSARGPRRTTGQFASGGRRPRAVNTEPAREVAADERQRAKEQLMHALRLTGVKLEEVRRKVRGEEDADGAPEERRRTR